MSEHKKRMTYNFTKEDIDIEKQFDFFIDKFEIDESTISEIDLFKIKQIFMAGQSQMFVLLKDIPGIITDPMEFVDVMHRLQNQIGDYWQDVADKNTRL